MTLVMIAVASPAKPDIAAPGSAIIAARAAGTSMGAPVDANYTSASGTSMATPHVTGAAALYASLHPGTPGAKIKKQILSHTIPTDSLAGITVTGGRLDVSGF